MTLSKKDVDAMVERALEIAFAGGRRANKMEHERNKARQKYGLVKKALRELRKVHMAAIHDNVKLTVENAALRAKLDAFEAANNAKIEAARKRFEESKEPTKVTA